MSLIVSALCVVLFVCVAHSPLRAHPVPFYSVAVLLGVFGVYFTFNPNGSEIMRAVAFAVQKGHVGFSLLAFVMFIGVFDKKSKIRQMLMPLRKALSIMGGILMCAHFIPYCAGYISMVGNFFSLRPSIAMSLVVAVVLVALLFVLVVTSFDVVRKCMKATSWKRVQSLSYVFFGLVFVHLLGYLLVSALGGSVMAAFNCALYGLVFGAYAVLRVRRALLDRKSKVA